MTDKHSQKKDQVTVFDKVSLTNQTRINQAIVLIAIDLSPGINTKRLKGLLKAESRQIQSIVSQFRLGGVVRSEKIEGKGLCHFPYGEFEIDLPTDEKRAMLMFLMACSQSGVMTVKQAQFLYCLSLNPGADCEWLKNEMGTTQGAVSGYMAMLEPLRLVSSKVSWDTIPGGGRPRNRYFLTEKGEKILTVGQEVEHASKQAREDGWIVKPAQTDLFGNQKPRQ